MMFVAYIDESGKKHDKTVLCLGGLVSTEGQWAKLEREWTSTLLDSPMPRYKDGRPKPFHMTDFEAGKGVFDEKARMGRNGKG